MPINKKSIKVGLYVFYNTMVGKYGQPFALCSKCLKKQVVPQACILHEIARDTINVCSKCE